MQNSIQMTVLLPTPLLQRGVAFVFPCSIARTTDEVEHPWCLSSHGEFLGILRSNFAIFKSTWRSPKCEECGAITELYLVNIYIEIFGVVDKSLYLLIFYKPHQGLSGVMRSCAHAYFYPRSTLRLDGLHLLLFTCQRDPSRGQLARRILLL